MMKNIICTVPLILFISVAQAQTPLLSLPSRGFEPPRHTTLINDIRVQLSAAQHTILSSELAGNISFLEKKEGDSFIKGETLIKFECSIHQARLNYALAAETASRQKYQIAKRLDKLKSISVVDLKQAQAEQQMAHSESQISKIMTKRCTIKAPFSGRVTTRNVQPNEYVAEGEELLNIYDDSAFEVELIIPSHWLTWLKIGAHFQINLEETEKKYPIQIIRIGSVIDPLSQSIKIFAKIPSANNYLLPGMSGIAYISKELMDNND